MRSMRLIARRELAQFFTSPIAYLVAFAIIVLTGFMFNSDLAQAHAFTSPFAYLFALPILVLAGFMFSSDLAQRVGKAPPDGTYVLGVFGFFTVFFSPLLTMRLFAEETREGTLELMLTMPVRDSDIVLGKFLGAWAYYSAILALTLVYPISLMAVTQPKPFEAVGQLDIGPVISSYIGIWLFGGAALAIGLTFSALTENQVIAGFLGIAVL